MENGAAPTDGAVVVPRAVRRDEQRAFRGVADKGRPLPLKMNLGGAVETEIIEQRAGAERLRFAFLRR